MKYIITESQYDRLLISENMGLTFWGEQILWGIDPIKGVQTNFSECQQLKSPREVFVEYYRVFKGLGRTNDQNIKNITSKLKSSMEGANLSTNKIILDFFKNNDDTTIGSVINNWRSNTKSNQTLYQWLEGEQITSWNDIMKSLSSNPKIKNKNYDIDFCSQKLSA